MIVLLFIDTTRQVRRKKGALMLAKHYLRRKHSRGNAEAADAGGLAASRAFALAIADAIEVAPQEDAPACTPLS